MTRRARSRLVDAVALRLTAAQRGPLSFRLLDPRNGPEGDSPPVAGGRRQYVIASVPRTGSTLLGRLLSETGRVGAPSEYLNPMQLRDWEVRLGSPISRVAHGLLRGRAVGLVGYEPFGPEALHAHLDRVAARRTGPSGWFGLKLHHHHLQQRFLAHGRDLSDWAPVARWIRIRRRDRLAQAISWLRALQSGRWAAWQPAGGRERYDRAGIEARLRAIDVSEAGWDAYFSARAVDPLTVWYEDLSADPGGTVSAVLAWLGEDPPLPVVAHREGVQRDAMSEDWAARFRRGA